MKVTLSAILLVTTFLSYGQGPYPSNGGTFTVSEIRGCAPLTVTVNAPDCDGSPGCDACYRGNDTNFCFSFAFTDTRTYTEPGTYRLQVVRGSGTPDFVDIVVVENTAPVFETSLCTGNQVFVKINDTKFESYKVNYNDGSGIVTLGPNGSDEHTYTAGARTVTVRGEDSPGAANCASSSKTITVGTPLTPVVINRIDVLDDAIRVQHNGVADIQYKLEIAINSSTSFQQIRTLLNKNVDTVTNLRPDDNYYCFRIGTFDPCNNQISYSSTICSANVDLSIENNDNVVSFVTSNAASPTRLLLRQNQSTSETSGFSVTTTPFHDTDVICGVEYCYQLVSTYANGGQSFSLQKCGTAISTDKPDALANVSSIVLDVSGAEFSWITPVDFIPVEYSVYKKPNNALIGTTATSPFTDATYTTAEGGCYVIAFDDICGNTSDFTEQFCPIQLTGSINGNNQINLEWNLYTGWEDGVVRQDLEKYTEDGVLIERIDVGTATTYLDETDDAATQVYIYRIVAYASGTEISPSISNMLRMIKDPQLFHPTAFTPNGDNLNDVFNVYGQYIAEFEMDIFNRWGELLFTTTDLDESWDGTFKNVAMPEGTYTFVANITDRAGRTFKKSGSILLLKKK